MLSRMICVTFPLGGLVNHRVHSCINGCLTLKFSGSWNTVTGSSPDFADPLLAEPLLALAPSELMFGSVFSLSGEIGMVSRGTGELDLRVVGAVTEGDMARVNLWKAKAVNAEGSEIRVPLRPQ